MKLVTPIWKRLYKVPQPRIVILCYHSIHPTRSFRSCSPEGFDAQLQWLTENCHVRSLQEVAEIRSEGVSDSKPKVVITFDDGYIDNYEYAFPLLQKWDVPFSVFLTVGFVDRDPAVLQKFQYLRRTSLEEVQPLTWTQVQEMCVAGMEAGAHTYSHPNMTHIEASEVKFELVNSKKYLEDKIGHPVGSFAYPFGVFGCHFDQSTVDEVQNAGYTQAVTTLRRGISFRDSPWTLPRLGVHSDDVEDLANKIQGDWDIIGYCEESIPHWLSRVLSPRAFRPSTYGA